MKKFISVFLAFIMVTSAIFAVPFTAYAKDARVSQPPCVSGDFEYTVLSDGTAEITSYYGFDTSVVIPSVVDNYVVTSIGERAFSYEPWPAPAAVGSGLAQTGVSRCAKITDVTIPDTVTNIEHSAFIWCENLVGIIIPDSVKSIGYMAFAYCDSLSYLSVGSSLQSIETNAFSSCENLQSIFVSENNKVYDSRDYCNAIIETSTNSLIVGCKNTVIPESVTSIGDYAFYSKGLDRVVIPDSVTSIGEYAFAYNRNLSSVNISDSVEFIDKGTFSNCDNLKYLTIGHSVKSIGDYAFYECRNLSFVTISNSVESIGDYAFYKCKNLRNVIIVNSVKSIGEYAFFGCPNLVEITIPEQVTSIGERAFGYVFDEINLQYVVIDGFIIYGYDDAEAMRYANDNEIEFVSLSEKPEFEIGDADSDGYVTIMDATHIQRHIAMVITIPQDRLVYADVDKDGEVNILDATTLQLKLAYITESL